MKVIPIYPHGFAANTYAITVDNKTAIVIDPSQTRVLEALETQSLTPVCVLLTHCHFDHVGGVAVLQEQGAKVFCGEIEKPLTCTDADMSQAFGNKRVHYTVDETFTDGESKNICGIKITCIHTPGHTKGSVCYIVTDGEESVLFSGDTLFARSVGRTDLITGSPEDLKKSLKKLLTLDKNYLVLSGHGPTTYLDVERKENPFLQNL